MRWETLFADLEAQLERETVAEDQAIEADEERRRLARIVLRDRLIALAEECPLRIRLTDGSVVELVVDRFGKDWLTGVAAQSAARRRYVVPLAAVTGVITEPTRAHHAALAGRQAGSRLIERLDLAVVLRELCRRRLLVEIATTAGMRIGTIDRVASDHLDLAGHDPELPRRADAVRWMEIVPFGGITSIAC